ncbi:hypothetical protein CQ047_08625 [Microbacterium sp. MYb72]|nr:ATP-binding cassette domain-containing protein [Microbacterium sp. MYb72]PRB09998.1 hypothetical protein CQ047_08625 [Microbacterium sp. MYb72]
MPDGQVLEFTRVTKRFNDVTAVSDFSARVEPGVVTAFLGPNGAGKTTSLRILLGQVRPTSGTATIGGVPYADLRTPLRTIGSVLEETVYRPRRTAARQLTIAAKANGIPLSRVDEVLALVGLDGEGEGRIGSFSLGMRQRLSVAHALLGDAGTLVFDEPANGLDPEGIRWMRLLMRRLADEGRTVLVSSHVLSEVEQVADHVLVLSKGRLVLSSGIESLADPAAGSVVVDAADRAALTSALAAAGFEVEVLRSGLTVRGGDAKTVGSVAAAAGVALSTLVQRGPTLEDVFIELVRGGKLAPHAEAVASQLVLPEAPASAADDAAEETPAAEAPVDEESAEYPSAEDVLPLEAESVPGDPLAAAVLTAGAGAAIAEASSTEDAADAASDAVDAAADAEDAAADVDHAAAELGYAAEAADAEDTADAADDATDDDATDDDADTGSAEAEGEVAESTETEEAPAADVAGGPSFDEILFGTASADAGETATEPHDADEGAEHSGLEVFEGLDSSEEMTAESESESEASDTEATESEASETTGDEASETVGDEGSETASEEDADPRAAAVSSMLAAAARAYYEDEPKDYPFGEAPTGDEQGQDEGAHWSVATTGVIDAVPTADGGGSAEGDQASDHHEHEGHEHEGEHHEGENHEGEHHEGEHPEGEHPEGENHEGDNHEGENHEGEGQEHHEAEHHDGEHHDHHHG